MEPRSEDEREEKREKSDNERMLMTIIISLASIAMLVVTIPLDARFASINPWLAPILPLAIIVVSGRLLVRLWDRKDAEAENPRPTYEELEEKVSELSERLGDMETITSYEIKRGAENRGSRGRNDQDDEEPPSSLRQ